MRDGLAVVSQILSFKYQSLSDQSLLHLSIFIFAYYLMMLTTYYFAYYLWI